MALKTQSGGLSSFWMGRQSPPPTASRSIDVLKFTPVSAAPVTTREASVNRVGKIIQRRFPFTGTGFGLASEQAESASITGKDSSSKRAAGQLWSEGDITTELLPTDIIHWLRVLMNKTPAVHAADGSVGTAAPLSDGASGNFSEGTEYKFGIPSKCVYAKSGLSTGDVITIVGTRRIGLPSGEVRPISKVYTVADGSLDFETDFYFNSISSSKLTRSTTTSTLAPTSYNTDTYKTSMTGFGDTLSDGFSIMQRVGLMPMTAYDVLINNFVLAISDAITATMSMIGGPVFNRRVIGTGNSNLGTNAAELTNNDSDSNKEWLSDIYGISDLDFAPAWGSLLTFGDTIVDSISLDLGVNLNLESKRSYRASRYRNKPGRSTTPRQTTISPRVYFENDDDLNSAIQDWQDIYIDNSISEVVYSSYNYLDNGKQIKMEFTVPACQLIEVPTLAVEGSQDIERDLSFLSTDDSGFKFVVEGDKYTE